MPFRAVYGPPEGFYVHGEEDEPVICPASLRDDNEAALFVYRQTFDGVREGIIGLIDGRVLPHERTVPGRVVARTGLETSSLFLWTDELPELRTDGAPFIEARDSFGCLHQFWRVAGAAPLELRGELFLADGHHRFAAGWQLATIQTRSNLRTLAAHRLVMEAIELPGAREIDSVEAYWTATPPGFVRFGVVGPGGLFGIEMRCGVEERNLSVLHERVLGDVPVRPVRGIDRALDAVKSGAAKMAFLVQPLSIDEIEQDARRGILLPPKSTDFYPKLAAGLIMHRHQNESVTPPVAQMPGVRNPSS
jgi:hypothetical protein